MNSVNKYGESALMLVCNYSDNDSSYDTVKQFLEAGVDVNLVDNNGNDALKHLIMKEHKNPRTIELLLSHINKCQVKGVMGPVVEVVAECQNKDEIKPVIEVVDWHAKYLEFMKCQCPNVPVLEGDYDWKQEFGRVSMYLFWHLFKYTFTTTMSFDRKDITHLPKEIGFYKDLQNLDLRFNSLDELPEEITKLKNLTKLLISGNKFKEIPKQIFELSNLKGLSIRDNEITELPSQIEKLKNLEELYIYGNKIKCLPKEIGNLSKLEYLSIQRTQIKEFPKEIENLTNLLELEFSNDQLCILSGIDFSKFTKLDRLTLVK